MTHRILRLPEVKKITGLSRATIYAMINGQKFPRQILLGSRAVGWSENEILQWVEERVSLRQSS